MQKTDFDYEILIHDDASTDRTTEIIREYESKYPDVIRPIYQTENQYSKGDCIITRCILPRARGKYIALCEGDDYWTDPLKLKKQVDYMEAHPECSMCFHAVEIVNNEQEPTGNFIRPYRENRIVPVEDVIVGGGGFFGTNSVIYLKKCMNDPPEFYLISPVRDEPLALNLSIQGTVYYIDEVMSAYRKSADGSWSSRTYDSKDKIKKHYSELIKMRNSFNSHTNFRYASSVERAHIGNEAAMLIAEGDVKRLKSERYKKYYNRLGKYGIAKIYLNNYFPNIHRKLSFYKSAINALIKRFGIGVAVN